MAHFQDPEPLMLTQLDLEAEEQVADPGNRLRDQPVPVDPQHQLPMVMEEAVEHRGPIAAILKDPEEAAEEMEPLGVMDLLRQVLLLQDRVDLQ